MMLIFCLLTTSVAFARVQGDVTDGLSEADKTEIAAIAAQKRADAAKKATEAPPVPAPQKVNEWIDVGKNAGLAITACAKEVGVAGDKFLESTTGKITITLIACKMLKLEPVSILFGTLMYVVLMSGWLYFFKKLCVVRSITKTPIENSIRSKIEIDHFGEGSVDGTRVVMWITLIAIHIFSSIIIL